MTVPAAWKIVHGGFAPQVENPGHDVVFLVGLGAFADAVEIPQILLGGFQFHDSQKALRRGTGEAPVGTLPAAADGRQRAAVARGIGGGDDVQRVRRGQGPVDVVRGIGPAVVGEGLGASVFIAGVGERLIPDAQDPRGFVCVLKNGIGVVDAGVHDADERPRAPLA